MSGKSIFSASGGTVQAGSGLYLTRSADSELLELCKNGTFAYVLTSRQLGKSSLIIHAAQQLSAAGFRTVVVSLDELGTTDRPEVWYLGILTKIADELELETDILGWWQQQGELSVTQRLTHFFRYVVLREVQEPIRIFFDEIDMTLGLAFTDDFFTVIRYIHNARARIPEFQRLSFILIGVAKPSDLIGDTQRTPFNVGQRVELKDFTLEEAMPLTQGFTFEPDKSRQVLQWVLDWTGGHPYLTQRVCSWIARNIKNGCSRKHVNRAVAALFFGSDTQQDHNLDFVSEMLTKGSDDKFRVLSDYRQVRLGFFAVPDEEQSPSKVHLKLAGVVRPHRGNLRLRNAIYHKVFDRRWLHQHLQTGLFAWYALAPKSVKISSIAITVLFFAALVFAVVALKFASDNKAIAQELNIANHDLNVANQDLIKSLKIQRALTQSKAEAKEQAEVERRKAESFAEKTLLASESERRALAEAMKQRRRAIAARDSADSRRMREEVLRKIEIARHLAAQAIQMQQVGNSAVAALLARQAYIWSRGRLNNQVYEALRTTLNKLQAGAGGPRVLEPDAGPVRAVALSSTGRYLATGGNDGTISIWDVHSDYKLIKTHPAHRGGVRALAFQQDRDRLFSTGNDSTIKMLNLQVPKNVPVVMGRHNAGVRCLAISGDILLSSGADNKIRLWAIPRQSADLLFTLNFESRVRCLALSPDGSLAACGVDGAGLKIIRTLQNKLELLAEVNLVSDANSLVFSPNDTTLLVGQNNGQIACFAYDRKTQNLQARQPLIGHNGAVNAMRFDAQGNRLVSASADRTVNIWNWHEQDEKPLVLSGHNHWVWTTAISPSGWEIISGSEDKKVRVWQTNAAELSQKVCDLVERDLTEAEWSEYIPHDLKYEPACTIRRSRKK